jgi:hypothetical protein
MSIFRNYFSKNNGLIDNNLTNNSQNPVHETSYGTYNQQVSRFIFDIDLENLKDKIDSGLINPNKIVSHKLHMTNTISNAQEYLGKKSYISTIERATSFTLDLFNVDEEWDEGSGYEFVYNDELYPDIPQQASNWFYKKTNELWNNEGAYNSGTTFIIGNQRFEKGCEDIEIDVTDYINQKLFTSGYTGTSTFTGTSYGLGLKFTDELESLETEFREAVAFHTKHTNTWYEPYIETIIDDTITDDRNYFYLDKDNDLYLYVNIGNFPQNIIVNQVNIYDYEDNMILTFSGNTVENVTKGIYKITLNIDSITYPDAVLFRDEWILTINDREVKYNGDFYLISQDKYYSFDNSNQINFNNYHFNFWGISEKENIRRGITKKIKLSIKELYPIQDNFIPLQIEYRLFTTVGKKYEIDVIPFTNVNRTNTGYEFNLDTSWLIPQDYYLQIRMRDGNYYENKETLSFTIVSDGVI